MLNLEPCRSHLFMDTCRYLLNMERISTLFSTEMQSSPIARLLGLEGLRYSEGLCGLEPYFLGHRGLRSDLMQGYEIMRWIGRLNAQRVGASRTKSQRFKLRGKDVIWTGAAIFSQSGWWLRSPQKSTLQRTDSLILSVEAEVQNLNGIKSKTI